jgi:glycosyltransferase involved in cell wall biosynthesis
MSMKIAQVVEAAAGGTGRHILDLTRGLRSRGHEITVIYSPCRAEQKFVDGLAAIEGVRAVPLGFRRELGLHDFRHLLELKRTLTRLGPFDVIHGHSSKAGALVRLLPRSVPGVRAYTPHAVRTMDPTLSRAARLFYTLLERVLAPRSRMVLAGSVDEVAALRAIGVRTDRIELLKFGIARPDDLSRERAREAHALAPEDLVIGFVGRLTAQKAPERVVRAIARLGRRDVKLALVGDGEDEPLRSIAADEGVAEQIAFLGALDGQQVMPAFDMIVIPSRYDSSPYVLLEAIMAGVPIVATPIGMAEELLAGEGAGRLVPNTDDPDPWCAAVESLLEPGRLDEARSSVLRLQSARSLDTMVGQMESVYGRMVAAS